MKLVASAVLALSLLVCLSSYAQSSRQVRLQGQYQGSPEPFVFQLSAAEMPTLSAAVVMPPISPEALPDAPRQEALITPITVALVAVVPTTKPVAPRPKLIDKKFMALGVLVFGSTSLDMELTQHCLQRKQCVELNPTLSTNHAGMYLENTPVNLGVMWLAYKRRAGGHRDWWIWPAIDAGIHIYGLKTNVGYAFGKR